MTARGEVVRPRGLVASMLRPQVRAETLTLLLSIALVLVYNQPFWTEVVKLRGPFGLHDLSFLVSLFLILVGLVNLLLSLISVKYLLKPVVILILTVAALVTYSTSSYGVLIDSTMIQNTFETDPGEIRELLSGKLLLFVLMFAALPALLVCRTRIRYRPWYGELKIKAVTALASVAIIAAMGALHYADHVSLFSNGRHLRHLMVPLNYLYATFRYLEGTSLTGDEAVLPLGQDAHLSQRAVYGPKKMLTILVLGETARSQEYSLNGYERETNPWLVREPVVSFQNVDACGTSTAVSLPCMFARQGRRGYDGSEVKRREGLLDVLARAGLSVLWRDNNSGCKGVCDRIETEDPRQYRTAEYCVSGNCYDEVLLNGLEDRLASMEGSALVVLHLNGSHGPAYHLRYPAAFRRFVPECSTNQLQECSRQQIVNSYDNSILYTDYVVDQVIRLLEDNRDKYNTAMIYVSDHGESLGENGVYLHGLPYFLAPTEQTQVPFVVWLSPGTQDASSIDVQCLNRRRDTRMSHDNFFHSVLGLMDVETAAYDEELDIFAACRRGSGQAGRGQDLARSSGRQPFFAPEGPGKGSPAATEASARFEDSAGHTMSATSGSRRRSENPREDRDAEDRRKDRRDLGFRVASDRPAAQPGTALVFSLTDAPWTAQATRSSETAGASAAAAPLAVSQAAPAESVAPALASGAPDLRALLNDDALESGGTTIGEVVVRIANVFDPDQPGENRRLFRWVNHLHRRTRERVIRRELLFEPGESYSKRRIEESARTLREADYLSDADIRVLRYENGVVDVDVHTQDVWSLKAGAGFGRGGGKNAFQVGLEDENFLGLGKSLSFKHSENVDRTSDRFRYADPNLFGRRMTTELLFSDNSDGQQKGIALERPFFSLDARWAAGVSGSTNERVDARYVLGEVLDRFGHSEEHVGVWAGFSRGFRDGRTRRWRTGVAFENDRFSLADGEPAPAGLPPDRRRVFPWVELQSVADGYIVVRDLDRIERREDRNLGLSYAVQLGLSSASLGADRDQALVAASYSSGLRPGDRQFLFFDAKASGWLDARRIEDVRIGGGLRYYVRDFRENVLFAGLQIDVTHNQPPEGQLLLGGDSGLRGYPLRYQDGDRRVLFTLEQRIYTDWHLFRVIRVGAAAFVDVGRSWFAGAPDFKTSGWLSDVGVGLRLGTSRTSAAQMVHFDLALPLDRGDGIPGLQFLIRTRNTF